MFKHSKVIFISENLEKAFNSIPEEEILKKHIKRAIEDLKINAFSGTQIPKRLFPKEYIQKYKVTNLWKYDLPQGWRIIYTIARESEVQLLSVILEFFNHKEYSKRFKYKN